MTTTHGIGIRPGRHQTVGEAVVGVELGRVYQRIVQRSVVVDCLSVQVDLARPGVFVQQERQYVVVVHQHGQVQRSAETKN